MGMQGELRPEDAGQGEVREAEVRSTPHGQFVAGCSTLRRTLAVLAVSLVASLATAATGSAAGSERSPKCPTPLPTSARKSPQRASPLDNFEYSTNETTCSSGMPKLHSPTTVKNP